MIDVAKSWNSGFVQAVKRESERERERRERDEICVINGKYKEISWRVRKKKRRKRKVTSRSTE